MVSKVLRRLMRVAAMLAGASLVLAGSADATRPVRRTARPAAARGFNLFAGNVNVIMNVNRVQCNINNIGESCVDPTNSPSLAGGFWPRGTGNQYIFNAGLQIAGRIGGTDTPTFPWPGDTVGAFFFDPRGDQAHGEGRTNVFNSLSRDDLAEWPDAANIRDTALFHPALVTATFGGLAAAERQAISQQDTWVRFWDGNTNLTSGRQHPMGLLVEQRGLAWNFPSGNQDIVYFLYRFINISSINAADYAGLLNQGYTNADITEIVAIAQEFQQRSEAAFNVDIPDGGYPFTDLFAAFAQDPDVTAAAGNNFSSANLVFSVGSVYSGAFQAEASFVYPPDINGAPFAAAPGFEGVKYLKSPQNIGIAMFGNTTNGGAFPDSRGVQQLWRRLSANLTSADGTCSVPNPAVRRFCFVNQAVSDTRFFQSSGPFTLNPGEASVIVVAYLHAAPLGTAPAATPPFGPAIPAFSLPIGTVTPPGLPMEGQRLFTGADLVKTYDRAMGWLNHADLDLDGIVEQCTRDRGTVPVPVPGAIPAVPCITEVTTQPRSLLGKAQVAQAVFDNKFLLPFAPEAPRFFLVPGDNRVTIAWQASETETIGDPYFSIASNPLSPLFDPNFRQFDVEGYRIWRGRTQAALEVIASFDYSGTTMTDFTGQFFVAANYGNQCAPELGIVQPGVVGATCPVAFNAAGTGATFAVPLSGDVIQVPPGGRVETAPPLANGRGTVLITTADTAVTGGGTGLPGLTDTGVPFSFVDSTARNGFRYFYAVTAFDVNSVRSGPSSLESPLITQTTTPRVGSGQEVAGQIGAVEMRGRGTALLNPNAAVPTLDPATGIFSGPMPPTDGLNLDFAAFLPELLADGAFEITMDSVVPGSGLVNVRPGAYWFHAVVGGNTVNFAVPVDVEAFDATHTSTGTFEATSISTAQSARFGGDSTFSLFGVATVTVPGAWRVTQWGRGNANGAPANSIFNGPRWWTGAANETQTNPNGSNCPDFANCIPAGATMTNSAGQLTGVTTLIRIGSYSTVPTTPGRDLESITSYLTRAADFAVYWGAAGVIDSVIDVTHNVVMPFTPNLRVGWGLLTAASFAAVPAAQTQDGNNALLTWADIFCTIPALVNRCNAGGTTAAVLQNTATLTPISTNASTYANTPTLTATGNGFIFYLNGHFFHMQMAALPAAGTVWNARFYSGTITGTAGSYAFTSEPRPPAVPGLRASLTFTGSTFDVTSTNVAQLANVHTVPDPYYVTNSLEITANTKILRFVNLPSQAIIRIYSASGILVNVLSHNDPLNGSEATWNLRNRNNQFVASGVYFYHVETPDGREKVGRFTVVNFAQ